jgi:hypothetical protein
MRRKSLKEYEVQIYLSGFFTKKVKACHPEEAIEKARKLPFNKREFFSNLEPWPDADQAEEIKNGKNR